MKRLLLAAMAFVGVFATAVSTSAQPEYLVYEISTSLYSYGERYGKDDYADRGQRNERWLGHLLYDCDSNLGVIIWRSVRNNHRYYDIVDPQQTLIRYNVEYHPGSFQNIYASLSGEDGGQLPDHERMRLIYLVGTQSVFWPIGSTDHNNQLVHQYVSPMLNGFFLFFDQSRSSYQVGYLSARISVTATRFANQHLKDYNNDGVEDISDLVEYWEDIYRNHSFRPLDH